MEHGSERPKFQPRGADISLSGAWWILTTTYIQIIYVVLSTVKGKSRGRGQSDTVGQCCFI